MSGWREFRTADLDRLRPAWERAAAVGVGTVFQSFALARHWVRVFAGPIEIRLLVADDVPLVLPLILHGRRLALLGDGLFDYLDAIGPPAGLDAALAAQARDRIEALDWTEVFWTGVRAHSGFVPFWRYWAESEPFSAALQRPLAAGSIAREHRRYARRWRRAGEQGIELRREDSVRQRAAVLAWILEHKSAAFGAACVLGPLERRWIETMVAEEPEIAEIWSLRQGAPILAGLLCWRWRDVRYAYTISYDLRAAALSPGILLLFAVLSRSFEEGLNFDFLTGEQSFKRHFATVATPLLRFSGRRAILASSCPL